MQYVDPSSSGIWYQALLLAFSTALLFWSRLSSAICGLWRRARGGVRRGRL